MVDMVNDQMLRGGHNLTVHHNAFSSMFSDSVKCSGADLGGPLKFRQPVIIDSINECELSAGKGNSSNSLRAEFEICTGVKIGTVIGKKQALPSSLEMPFLLAGKYRPANSGYVSRKEAVVATF